jgi:hypothetical protein
MVGSFIFKTFTEREIIYRGTNTGVKVLQQIPALYSWGVVEY